MLFSIGIKKGGGNEWGKKGEILFERLGKMHRVATAKGRTHTETKKTTKWTLPVVEEGQGQASPQP